MASFQKTFLFAGLFLLTSFMSVAQTSLDSIQVKNLRGKLVTYGELTQKTPVVLLCFWSVNSEASVNELNAINKQYEKWKQLSYCRVMAICIDEGNLVNRMRPTTNMNGWTFDVYADINGDLQRALPFNNPPQSTILQNGKVVYQQAGFADGTEDYLFSQVRSLAPKK